MKITANSWIVSSWLIIRLCVRGGHNWNWVIHDRNKLLSSGKETSWTNIWIITETREWQRSPGIWLQTLRRRIHAVIRWATLQKWDADKKKDQRTLSRTEWELGVTKRRYDGFGRKVWWKGERAEKNELLGRAESSKYHVACLRPRSQSTPTSPPAWFYRTKQRCRMGN